MRQAGLFGLSDHLKRLSADGDPLGGLGRIVDFGAFRPTLVAALAYGDGLKGGRPPYDPVAMLKVLILAAQNTVSDARMEYLGRDRLSWLRFLGFDLGAPTPDANTIRLFREVGLYYYKARMYSPTLGRFMQTDPIGYADGMNWYNYVGGDPINRSDPSGLAEADIVVPGMRFTTTGGAGGGGGGFGGSNGCGFFTDSDAPVDFCNSLMSNSGGGGAAPNPKPKPAPGAKPQNVDCSQAVVDFGNGLINFANDLNGASDKFIVGAGGVAIAGLAVGSTGLGLPIGLTAEGLATTGGLGKAIAGTVGLIGSGLVAGQTKNGSFTIATAFSAAAAWVTIKNPLASFLQDKMVSAASRLVGADKPPTQCPTRGRK